MKRNTRRTSTLKMHRRRPAQSKLAAAIAMLMSNLSIHKRRAVLIVLLGVLCAAVLAPSVSRLPASTTAASTAATQQDVKQGAPELRASPRARAALQRLQRETGERVVSHLSNKTGNFDFVRATGDALLAADKGSGTPEARAQAFLSVHGAAVGLSDAELRRVATGDSAAGGPSSELRVGRVDRDSIGGEHVRFSQFYQGVPVFGAQLIVHMNARGITAVNGDFVPDLKFAGAPRIGPKEAGQIALRYQLAGAPLTVVKTELSIYRVGLLEGYRGPSVLAYGVEVTDRRAARDQIWINANNGKLINRIPLNHKLLDRTIYSPMYDPDNPTLFVVKEEGDPPFPGPPAGTSGANPIDNLYLFAGHTYNLFASAFGRDSYDGLGHAMASVYLINDACPNAYWNGNSTNYCPDLDADDVVAHEWGHAYTQFTHGLIYQYQSGALNESYSDIFGEVVDLHNGVDAEGGSNNAQPLPDGQRWQVGDDVPTLNNEELGILRDMWDPTRYGQPDKVSSPNYSCGSGDNGGVHANSGVPNHAFAMLVDGKTFNGQTVQAIGFTKALHIYYRAMTFYQTPTTDFPAHDQALQASCADLANAATNLNALSTDSANSVPSGQIITANDCLQVAKAMLAVEMSMPSPCPLVILLDPNPPEICSGATDIFTENWETGMDGWTLTSTGVFADWEDSSRSIRDFSISSTLPAGRTGSAAYARNAPVGQPGGGDCQPGSQDYSGQFTIDSPTITIPAGASTLNLSFDHYVATEATFDGGQLEISVNGAAFSLVAQEIYLHNPPNSQFDAPPPVGLNTNPNAGEYAWHGTNIGTPSGAPPGSWGTTLVDLSSLTAPGNTIKIRFTYSQDGCNGVDGWYVDNVRLFSCPTLEAPTLSIGADYEDPDTDGSYTFNWVRPAGAIGPDVLQESSTSCVPLLSDNAESGLGQWTVFSSALPPTLTTWDNAPANSKPQHNSATFWGHGAEQETQNTFTTLTYNNPITIPNSGTTTLKFSDWYFNEDDDNGFVEVSTNNGATWTQVYSAFRAMGDLADVGANAFANETLTDRSVNLTIYSGQSIRLRFKYECGESNFFLFIQYGWHIDNISITSDNWQDVTTINATTFTVSGRGPGTRCYRVRTTYTFGSQSVPSPYSNIVSATVLTGGCLYTLDPTSEAFPASGGSGTVSVTTASGCNWIATSNDGFITINSGSSGTGDGTVNYTVASNSDASSRSGSMTIAGQTFIVTQAGTGAKSISGTISYCIDPAKKVPNATVSTTAGAPSASSSSDSNGFYQLRGLDDGAYTVTPSKTANVGDGITAFDAALVAQFVAGVIPAPNNCQTLAGDASNSGALSALDAAYIAQTVAEISNPGIAGTWKFVPSSRSYASLENVQPNQNYDAVLVGDVSGNWAPAGPEGPSQPLKVSIPVSLPNTAASKGSTNVMVPVTVGNTTGLNVLAYAFTFTFDPTVIQLASPAFETSGTLSQGWNITANALTPGRIRIVAFNAQPLSGSGTLIFVKFNVVGSKGAVTPLTWTNFPFNEGNPGATLTNGTLKVKKQKASSTSSLLPVMPSASLLKAEAGGAVAVWVSSVPLPNHLEMIDQEFYHFVFPSRSRSPRVKPPKERSPPQVTSTFAARGFFWGTRL